MKNKGNQKHLTFEQRVDIEKGLTENKSFTEIGRIIGKDPSTISKEVRLHAHTKERPDLGYTNPPCIHRKTCKIVCLCDKQCGSRCKLCRRPDFRCIDICPAYETAECEKLNLLQKRNLLILYNCTDQSKYDGTCNSGKTNPYGEPRGPLIHRQIFPYKFPVHCAFPPSNKKH